MGWSEGWLVVEGAWFEELLGVEVAWLGLEGIRFGGDLVGRCLGVGVAWCDGG